jgi:hypothetical protein
MTVEVTERITFWEGRAVRWQKSLDGGHTWEDVEYAGERLPFVLLRYDTYGWKEHRAS